MCFKLLSFRDADSKLERYGYKTCYRVVAELVPNVDVRPRGPNQFSVHRGR